VSERESDRDNSRLLLGDHTRWESRAMCEAVVPHECVVSVKLMIGLEKPKRRIVSLFRFQEYFSL